MEHNVPTVVLQGRLTASHFFSFFMLTEIENLKLNEAREEDKLK
jgi:hypothetical protein